MRAFLFVAVAFILTALSAPAQSEPPVVPGPAAQSVAVGPPAPSAQSSAQSRFTAALAYQVQRSNAAPGVCGCFALQGMRAEFTYHPSKLPEKFPTVLNHFSGVFELGGNHASNIHGNGLDLSLVTYLVGPRYSRNVGPKLTPFAQVLFGGVHGFDSIFPRRNEVTSSGNSFALSAGGGVDLAVSKRFSVRLFQIDFLKTALPNGESNGQNNLRVSAGLVAQLETAPDPSVPGHSSHSMFGRLKAFLRHPFRRGQ